MAVCAQDVVRKKRKWGNKKMEKTKDSIRTFLFSDAIRSCSALAKRPSRRDAHSPATQIGRYGWRIALEILEDLIKLDPVRWMKNIRSL